MGKECQNKMIKLDIKVVNLLQGVKPYHLIDFCKLTSNLNGLLQDSKPFPTLSVRDGARWGFLLGS